MKNDIYEFFNDVKIDFNDYDRQDFDDIEKKKLKIHFRKSLNNKKKKYMKAVNFSIISILCILSLGTEGGRNVLAEMKTDIAGMLGVEENIDNYKTEIGETAIDKNIEIKINDVMFDDENNLIISREIKSDKKIEEFPYGTSEDIYINGKKIEFRWDCISEKIIGDYLSADVDKYALWSEDGNVDLNGDVNIKIVYTEVGEYPNYTKGNWIFEFNYSNMRNLEEETKRGEVDYKFKIANGGEISLDTYKINALDAIIYGKVEWKDDNNPYIVELRGKDDKGNDVILKLSGGHDHMQMSPSKGKINLQTKSLTLTPYAMKFPKNNEKTEGMVKVGEEFTINIDK